jgi:hypothetical protein
VKQERYRESRGLPGANLPEGSPSKHTQVYRLPIKIVVI